MAKDQQELERPRVIAHVSASTRVRDLPIFLSGESHGTAANVKFLSASGTSVLGLFLQGQLLVEPCAYKEFQQQASINSAACSADGLYPRTLVSTPSVLRCPSQKKGRVSMLRAALGHANTKEEEKESNDPKADLGKLRRTVSSTLDSQSSHERKRQAVNLPDAIAE